MQMWVLRTWIKAQGIAIVMLQHQIKGSHMQIMNYDSTDAVDHLVSYGDRASAITILLYGSGHENVAVLLPGFAINW